MAFLSITRWGDESIRQRLGCHGSQKFGLLESTSMILGLFDNAVDSQATIEMPIRAGDRVLIYTDGLIENFDSQGEMLGVDGLRTIVKETCHLPLPDMKQQILDRVASGRSGPAADDVSLVLVEIP